MAKIKYFNGRGYFMDVEVNVEFEKGYDEISDEERRAAWRKRKRDNEFSLELALERDPDFLECDLFAEDLNVSIDNELHLRLYEAINQLPKKHIEILIKYFFEKKSMQEIANEYSVQKPAISKLIDRILQKLKEILEKMETF